MIIKDVVNGDILATVQGVVDPAVVSEVAVLVPETVAEKVAVVAESRKRAGVSDTELIEILQFELSDLKARFNRFMIALGNAADVSEIQDVLGIELQESDDEEAEKDNGDFESVERDSDRDEKRQYAKELGDKIARHKKEEENKW